MSLPLSRRVARAALLTAAGAASVVGATGAASAADLSQTPGVGSLTSPDGAGLGGTVDGTVDQARSLGQTAGGLGEDAKQVVDQGTQDLDRNATPLDGNLPERVKETGAKVVRVLDGTVTPGSGPATPTANKIDIPDGDKTLGRAGTELGLAVGEMAREGTLPDTPKLPNPQTLPTTSRLLSGGQQPADGGQTQGQPTRQVGNLLPGSGNTPLVGGLPLGG